MDLYASFVRHVIAPLWSWKDHSLHYRYLSEFEQTQFWKPEEIRHLQWRLLKNLISHAYIQSIFYRRRFDQLGIRPENIQSFQDFLQIPFLTKGDIQDKLEDLLAKDYPPGKREPNQTGGSTGSPLAFYQDRERTDSRRASTLRHNRWAGWEVGDKIGILWGARQDFTPLQSLKAKIRNYLLDRHLVLDTSSLTEAKLFEFSGRLLKFKPKIILAYANSMFLFTKFVQANQIRGILPKSIITSAESLSQEERTAIQDTFGCPVFDRYGSRETSVIASECEQHKGLHVNAETLYVEIVKNGRPAGPGETGEVVITDLLNFAMPFIRYKIEDAAVWAEGECPCARGLPRLARIEGRVTDFILTPEGKLVSGASLTIYLITKIPGLRQVQIVQDRKEHLLLRLVKDQSFTSVSMQILQQRIGQMLGNGFQLDFEFLPEILRESSGKYRFSISSVTPEFFK